MKLSEAAKRIIAAVAPVLGTAVGGPLGAAAGTMIAKQLGVEESKVDAVIAAGSPETLLKLREAENEFKLSMEQLGVDLERVHAEDRDSARKREMDLGDTTPRTLAYMYLTLFLVTLAMQFWLIIDAVEIKEGAVRVLDGLTAILGTLVTGSKDYYFGSSMGSKHKTDILSK